MHSNLLMESSSFIRQRGNIPEDIVIQILSLVPIKSLLRFSCVSKVWRSLISDPKFALSSSQRHLRIAVQYGDLYSFDAEEASSSNDVLAKPMICACRILGSCNGLLLVSHNSSDNTDLYLWNPTTRQSTKMLSILTDQRYEFHFNAKSGLCYDSNCDDYKAVMVGHGLVTVVSFKRKYWATKTCSFANEDVGERWDSGPVVNEKLHWVSRVDTRIASYLQTIDQIVYFDPLTDEFVELPMPLLPDNGKHNSVLRGLGVLEGCLCMTHYVCKRGDEIKHDNNWEDERGFYHRHEFKPTFTEVLVMKEHGVGESWTSSFIISNNVGVVSRTFYPRYGSLVPLCLTKNGEILFWLNGDNGDDFLVYNPDEMSKRVIHIRFQMDDYHFRCRSHVASYMESLASPAAYGLEKDWIVKGSNALHLLYWDRQNCYSYCDSVSENYTDEDNSVEEHDDFVLKGFWKRGENKEKFVRKAKSQRYSSSRKEKKQEAQQRIRAKRKITCIRKNQREHKQGKNMEVEDLHKQVLDFSVN